MVGQWLMGQCSVVGGSVKDLLLVQESVFGGRWVGGKSVGRSVVGYRWLVGFVIRLKERKD